MLSQYALSQITNRVAPIFAKGAYIKNGEQIKVPVFRKELDEESNTIKVYLYLTDEDTGDFSEFQLLDESDNVVDTEPYEITKDIDKGMVIVFKYKITAERLYEAIE